MKKQWAFYLSVNIICLTLALFACKKEKDTELEFDTQASQDNSLAESTFNDANNIANQAIENGSGGLLTYRIDEGNSILSICASVTVTPDSTGPGGSVDIDFGSQNCYCRDFRFRRGIIHVQFTGAYRDSGTVITTTFNNYYVGRDSINMHKVTGTKIVTNKGHNADNHLWYTVNVNGQLENKNEQILSWSSQRQREWIAGESTTGINAWTDDQYYIRGSAEGTSFEGTHFTVNITKRLWVALDCAYVKEGTFELTPTGKPTRVFDYGDGICNDSATVTVNSTVFPIRLR